MRIRLRRLQPILLGVAALGVLLYFVFESRGMGREEHARGEIALVKLRDALEDLERKVLVARNEPSRAAERLLEVDERVKTALAIVEKAVAGHRRRRVRRAAVGAAQAARRAERAPGIARFVVHALLDYARDLPAGDHGGPAGRQARRRHGRGVERGLVRAVAPAELGDDRTHRADDGGARRIREKAKLNPKLAPSLNAFVQAIEEVLAKSTRSRRRWRRSANSACALGLPNCWPSSIPRTTSASRTAGASASCCTSSRSDFSAGSCRSCSS
jgi:hypothetical protein